MKTITFQDIKSRGAKAIPDDATVYLIVNSKPKSVLVPPDEYASLIETIEEYEDIKAIEERKNEENIEYNEVFPKKAA